jgi:putative methyltransferase (TIGR04325 family)
MGVHYFTLAPFLRQYGDVDWIVCETPATARAGNEHFRSDGLSFIEEITALEGSVDVVITSGALQYTNVPMRYLRELCGLTKVLVVNRLPLTTEPEDLLTVQSSDPNVFTALLPAWFFSEATWNAQLRAAGFAVQLRWTAHGDTVLLEDKMLTYQGMLATREPPERESPP